MPRDNFLRVRLREQFDVMQFTYTFRAVAQHVRSADLAVIELSAVCKSQRMCCECVAQEKDLDVVVWFVEAIVLLC